MIKKKFKKVNNVNLFSQHSLIIFTKDADIFGHDCTFIVSFTDEGQMPLLKCQDSFQKFKTGIVSFSML